MSWFRSPLSLLGTRAIMVLLAIALCAQALAVAGFIWERNERLRPAFKRVISTQIIQTLERMDEASPRQRLMQARRLSARGILMLPSRGASEVEGKGQRNSLGWIAEALEEYLDDSELEDLSFELVFLSPRSLQSSGQGLSRIEQRIEAWHRENLNRNPNSEARDRTRMLPPNVMPWWQGLKDEVQPIPALQVSFSDGARYYAIFRGDQNFPGIDWGRIGVIFLVGFLPLLIAFFALAKLRQATMALGEAARRFGDDLEAPHISLRGPAEVSKTVSAFNAMQARIRGLMGERTRMLAAISHDLRTQLTKLRMRAEYISVEKQRDKAVEDIEKLDALLGQVVQFSRMDSGNLAPEEPSDVDLDLMIANLIQDMSWQERVAYEPAAAPLIVQTGRNSIERIITNLIENALRYGERADVSLHSAPDSIVLQIDDQGAGIPDNMLEAVFEPFYRLESSRNLATGGSGLGLAIVKGLVEQLGGEIKLSNPAQGGLRAEVLLPLRS